MNEMDGVVRVDGPSTHIEDLHFSPSLPLHFWGHIPSPPGPRISYQTVPMVDETTLAQRTAAFRQLHGNPRSTPRKHRPTKSFSNRSALSSQPVIVRSYPADVSSSSPSTQSSSVGKGKGTMDKKLDLPSAGDYYLASILRAIEPDARETLEQIAEICGRSRLSLANEYGSHKPPLGEIRAPDLIPRDHTLLPVEEASSSNENLANELTATAGDEASVDGREVESSLAYGLLERLRIAHHYQLHEPTSSSWGDSSSTHVDHEIPRPLAVDDSALPVTHQDFQQSFPQHQTMRRRSANWPLLRGDENTEGYALGETLTSRPIVSELRLDARWGNGRTDHDYYAANEGNNITRDRMVDNDSYYRSPPLGSLPTQEDSEHNYPLSHRLRKLSLLNETNHWGSWFHKTPRGLNGSERQSAETNLRAILERNAGTQLVSAANTGCSY